LSHEEVEVHQGELYDEVIYGAATEPMQAVLEEGWKWVSGQRDTALRFPTFARSIFCPKPPKAPAGLDSCTEETRARWKADRFRFPPYMYAEEFMVKDVQGALRPLNATERELLMGFERDHTLAMAKKIPETEGDREEFEDLRRSA
jgi:hypothetical protein